MRRRIEEWSVGQLARAAGVTVRLLHHYDAIGLLRPAHVAANSYRLYRQAQADRLQEILLLRAAGLPLEEIGAALDCPGGRMQRLRAHRERLQAEARRLAAMLETVDISIKAEQEKRSMALEELYQPFTAEKQTEHESWLIASGGTEMAERIAASKAHLETAAPGMQARMSALREIEAALVGQYERGFAPADADCAAHRDWVGGMWGRPCTAEAYAGLAETYAGHPDFVARYEALSPGFGAWLVGAMREHAARHR